MTEKQEQRKETDAERRQRLFFGGGCPFGKGQGGGMIHHDGGNATYGGAGSGDVTSEQERGGNGPGKNPGA